MRKLITLLKTGQIFRQMTLKKFGVLWFDKNECVSKTSFTMRLYRSPRNAIKI